MRPELPNLRSPDTPDRTHPRNAHSALTGRGPAESLRRSAAQTGLHWTGLTPVLLLLGLTACATTGGPTLRYAGPPPTPGRAAPPEHLESQTSNLSSTQQSGQVNTAADVDTAVRTDVDTAVQTEVAGLLAKAEALETQVGAVNQKADHLEEQAGAINVKIVSGVASSVLLALAIYMVMRYTGLRPPSPAERRNRQGAKSAEDANDAQVAQQAWDLLNAELDARNAAANINAELFGSGMLAKITARVRDTEIPVNDTAPFASGQRIVIAGAGQHVQDATVVGVRDAQHLILDRKLTVLPCQYIYARDLPSRSAESAESAGSSPGDLFAHGALASVSAASCGAEVHVGATAGFAPGQRIVIATANGREPIEAVVTRIKDEHWLELDHAVPTRLHECIYARDLSAADQSKIQNPKSEIDAAAELERRLGEDG